MARVATSDISVVVQGAVAGPSKDGKAYPTRDCLASIRRRLPGAEIVLSTWQGSDVSGLDYDRLVLSDDPGAVEFVEVPGVRNNVNRQIVTTLAGLRLATRPYALKIRTDMLVTGTGFLDVFGRFPARSDWSFFRQKVVASTIFARVPAGIPAWPYHPGDWFFFGETPDLLDLWDLPLQPEPETTRWYVDKPRPPRDDFPLSMHRWEPEQYIWLSFLGKHTDPPCEHRWDVSRQAVLGSERSIASNLILISPRRAGLMLTKYMYLMALGRDVKRGVEMLLFGAPSCYGHWGWRYLYDRHCRGARLPLSTVARVWQAARTVLRTVLRFVLEETEGLRHPERERKPAAIRRWSPWAGRAPEAKR
jgi:hypothetical protein